MYQELSLSHLYKLKACGAESVTVILRRELDRREQEFRIQKYLAQTRGEVIETYNDMRRIIYTDGKYPVEMKNPNNTSSLGNRWPLRLPYGDSDVVSNPNVTAAFGTGNEAGMYIFTENVWWAGGSR